MTIANEIERIQGAKTDLKTWIEEQGVEVPAGSLLNGLVELLQTVPTGTDTTDATAAAGDILASKTAYVNGEKITGTIATKKGSDLTANGETVNVPAGYYAANVSKSVATAEQATPTISVSDSGLITASATQAAGYVEAGSTSATEQLDTQAAQTITPSTANQTIPAGKYLTGAQTVKGDSNLVAENIASGVSIFGVEGTHEGGGGGTVVTDDGNGNITISSLSATGHTDDGNGNVTID